MLNTEKNTLLSLFKKEKTIILNGLLTGLIAFIIYYLFFYIALYTTQAKILVKNFPQSNLITSTDNEKTIMSESGYSNPLFNFYGVLQSENIADKVYFFVKAKYPQDLLYLNVQSKEIFYEKYKKLINAVVEPSTDIMEVNLLWPNKNNSAVVLNEIIKEFKIENLAIKKTGETKTRKFLDEQTVEISRNLEKVRMQIKKYKLNSDIANIDITTENLINARMDLEKQAGLLYSQIQYNNAKAKAFSDELNIKDAQVALRAVGFGTDPYIRKLSQDLAVAKANYSRLRAKFKDKYPDVIAVKNEINELQNDIDKRKNETISKIQIPRSIYDDSSSQVVTQLALTQAEVYSLNEQFRVIRNSVNELKREERSLPKLQFEFDELKKLEDALSMAYQNIKEKQLEARIKENEIIDNFVVLCSPTNAILLKSFIITRFMGFLLLGSLLGLGVAYIKKGIEDKWADSDEIKEVTGQNILGIIPWFKDFYYDNTQQIMDIAYTNIASEIISKAHLNNSFILSFIATGKSKNKSVITEIISSKVAKMTRTSVLLIDLVPQNFKGDDLIDIIKMINKEIYYNSFNKIDVFSSNKNEQANSRIDEINKKKQIKQDIVQRLKLVIKEGYEAKNLNRLQVNKQNINLNDYIASKGFLYLLNLLKTHYGFIFINSPHGLILLPEIQTLKKISEGIILISSMETNRQELINSVNNINYSDNKIIGIIAREENSQLEISYKLLQEQEAV